MKKIYFLAIVLLNLCATAQIINIPDANFKAKLLAASPLNTIASNDPPPHSAPNYTKIDLNNNGEIEVSEAALITRLNIANSNISNVEGIQYFFNLILLHCYTNQIAYLDVSNFHNLKNLMCSWNSIANPMDLSACPQLVIADIYHNQLPSVNLSGLSSLTYLNCEVNQFTSLDVSDLVNLTYLDCNFNNITSLDVSNCTSLITFECFENNISTLILGNNTNLVTMRCYGNQITELDLSNLTSLDELHCAWNQLQALNLTNPTALTKLYCSSNPLPTVDVSTLSHLDDLIVGSNTLQSVYMKNGINETSFNILPSPNIQYICADGGQSADVQDYVNSLGYTSCVVDSSCSLSNNDFTISSSFTLYPNPANDVLNINSSNEIRSVGIYDLLGQLINSIPDARGISIIDVSDLDDGCYFIRINSDKGSSTGRFIKE